MALVVRHTFLEVVAEPNRRCRTLSDSFFELPEAPSTPCHMFLNTFPCHGQGKSLDNCDGFSVASTQTPRDTTKQRVASWADESESSGEEDETELTTVMFRNVPYTCTRDELLQVINEEGFVGKYDFVYLPADFRTRSSFGYAFINFVSQRAAEEFQSHFNGFNRWSAETSKTVEVGWSEPSQGLDLHVERYRNSPVMHKEVPDEFKPMLFKDGVRITFPVPTKAIRAPRIKRR